MAIYGNSLQYARSFAGVGLLNVGGKNNYFCNLSRFAQVHTSDQIHPTTSCPVGYTLSQSYLFPLIGGGISGKANIEISTSVSIIGIGLIDGSTTISISVSASGDLLANIGGTTTISITTSGSLVAIGYISGTCNIGADPSADDIAQAVLGLKIEGDYSMRDVLRIMSAVLAGKTSIVGSTAKFRNLQNTKDRLEASMTGSERTTINYDVT